jgi:hypothetical protein
VINLVAADDIRAAMDRSSRDRKHRFDSLFKNDSATSRCLARFQKLMTRTGVRKVRGLSVSFREAFITPQRIKEMTK